MRALDISFGGASRVHWLGWVYLLIGITCCLGGGAIYLQASERLKAAQTMAASTDAAARDRAAQMTAALQARNAPPAFLNDKRWLRASAELKLPWMQTLNTLEASTKPPVFLMGFKSDMQTGLIQLDGEASSFEEILAYVNVLQKTPALRHVWLQQHAESPDSTGRPVIRFIVQSSWVTQP